MSSIRTPSSLKWLIDKRARLLGEINKLEKAHPERIKQAKSQITKAEQALEHAKQELANIESTGPKLVELMRNKLQSVDSTLGLHEIQIDPSIIPPIRTPDTKRQSGYGEITRAIFECLKLAGGQPVTTFELTEHVADAIGLKLTDDNYQTFRKKISCRLKELCTQGKIQRLHETKRVTVGRWALPDDSAILKSIWGRKWGRPKKEG